MFSRFVLLAVLLLAKGGLALYDDYNDELEYNTDAGADDLREEIPRSLNNDEEGPEPINDEEGPDPINELSSSMDFATIDQMAESSNSEISGIINLATNSEEEHNRNYVKISSDLKSYEDSYKACLQNISDSDFSQETIDNCVGEEYQFVFDDIDYEKRKIQARGDNAIRTIMIKTCYNEAGADLVMDNACDLIQRDTLDLLWNELNFEVLIEYHREKYIFVHAKLPEVVFAKVINKFKDTYGELAELIEELYAHRDLTIARLKRDIDERTALITDKFRKQSDHPTPKIKKDLITIDEVLIDHPNYHLDLDNLPRPMIENGKGQMYAMDNNPWVQSFAHNIGPDHYASINTPYQMPQFDSPLIVAANKKQKRNLSGHLPNLKAKVPFTHRNGLVRAGYPQSPNRIQAQLPVRRSITKTPNFRKRVVLQRTNRPAIKRNTRSVARIIRH